MAILSIQSHVVYGYVGNKAAVFPLQAMGFDVWPINTVQFSNHTGYKSYQGDVLPANHITRVVDGLQDLGVIGQCQAVLSGYMGSAEICNTVMRTVARFKAINPQLIYLCDPVMGNDNCFVKPEVVDFFRHGTNSDIVTPNQFEAELLSGIRICNIATAKDAAKYFHNHGTAIVVITGIKLSAGALTTVLSVVGDKCCTAHVECVEYQKPVNGTGDLFSALFLGHFLKSRDPILALSNAHYITGRVLDSTYAKDSNELDILSVDYRQSHMI